MMRRRENYALEKVTINLREGDFDRLRSLHGRDGASKIIRRLVMAHIKRVDERVAQNAPIAPAIQQLKVEDLL